jgi:hypothetical protein
MNKNLLDILQQIVNEHGEDILNNPKRVQGLLADMAAREPKAEKKALGKCFEMGFYAELKNSSEIEQDKVSELYTSMTSPEERVLIEKAYGFNIMPKTNNQIYTIKKVLVERLHNNGSFDIDICKATLDLLEEFVRVQKNNSTTSKSVQNDKVKTEKNTSLKREVNRLTNDLNNASNLIEIKEVIRNILNLFELVVKE